LKDDEVDRLQKSLANIDGERAQLAERLQNANTEATDSKALAAANQEATAQLAALHEQLRQSQNQIASLASENAALKNRYALVGAPPSSSGLSAPTRPGTAGAAAAAVRPPTPTPAPAARTHVIASGDTLTKIARRYYGSSEKWNQILEANRGVIRDPNNLTVGATIRIP
jgi:nucleoid-associated protein YgaU